VAAGGTVTGGKCAAGRGTCGGNRDIGGINARGGIKTPPGSIAFGRPCIGTGSRPGKFGVEAMPGIGTPGGGRGNEMPRAAAGTGGKPETGVNICDADTPALNLVSDVE